MEEKGLLWVNIDKTKVNNNLTAQGKHACGVCKKGVGANSSALKMDPKINVVVPPVVSERSPSLNVAPACLPPCKKM